MYRIFFLLLTYLSLFISSFNHRLSTPTNHNLLHGITGKELFNKNCSSCHGKDLKGNPPMFPSLENIASKLKKENINEILLKGGNIMPSFSYLSKSDRFAIIAYLFGEKSTSQDTTKVNPVIAGKNLFIANCKRCHKVKLDDDTSISAKYCSHTPPVLGGISDRYNLNAFIDFVNKGKNSMPSFSNLSKKDKHNIYLYLNTFKGSKIKKKMGCGM